LQKQKCRKYKNGPCKDGPFNDGVSEMDDSTNIMKEQYQQHMAYIKNMTDLQHLFENLVNAQDKAEKIRLFKEIKMNIKINNLLNHYSV